MTVPAAMKVSEIFHSIQGEGLQAGVPSIFVRLAGCPLRCRWCDTPYAWSARAGKKMTARKIILSIEQYQCQHVVITGGEPLIWSQIPTLSNMLHHRGYHLTVETAGIQYRKFYCDLLSLSPKLSNSLPLPNRPAARLAHSRLIAKPAPIRRLLDHHSEYQLKFVVDCIAAVNEVKDFLTQLGKIDPERIMLMPQAADRRTYRKVAPKVARWAIESGWRFSPRLQIELYNGLPGT